MLPSQELQPDQVSLPASAGRWVAIFAALGVAGLALSVILATGSENARHDFFRSYLTNFMYMLSLALGGLFFVLISHLTRAGWSVALRRLGEIVSWTLLPLFVLSLPILLFGMHDLYEWTHAEVVAADPLLQHKSSYLNVPFFIARIVVYFVVWNVLAGFFVSRSRRQDSTGDAGLTVSMEKVAAPGMIVYALTVTFASFDFIMSLYPHWYSTIFGVYYFAGCVLGFFALVPVVGLLIQRTGRLRHLVTAEHYHDMGKLMFAFVVFWTYIAFSQYMLIWYGNIPEETVFFETRQTDFWLYISVALLVGHFFVPFLWLMSRYPKRSRRTLFVAGLWLLAVHWLDLFYLIVPESRLQGMPFRWFDLTTFVGLGGLFAALLLWRMRRSPLVPLKDPRLAESLGFENV